MHLMHARLTFHPRRTLFADNEGILRIIKRNILRARSVSLSLSSSASSGRRVHEMRGIAKWQPVLRRNVEEKRKKVRLKVLAPVPRHIHLQSYLPNVSFEKSSIEATADDVTMIMIRLVSHIS